MAAKIDVETVYPLDVTWEEWLDLNEEERDRLTNKVWGMAKEFIASKFAAGKAWVMLYGEPDNMVGSVTVTDWKDMWSSEKIEAFCRDRNRVAYHFAKVLMMP